MSPPPSLAAVLASLAEAVRRQPELRLIGPLRFVAAGLDFVVARATLEPFGDVALRTPWRRAISNVNDEAQDARDLLEQEELFLRHTGALGLPVPAVHGLYLGASRDFLLTGFVAADGSEPAARDMGAALAVLHRGEPPERVPVAQRGGPLPEILAGRLAQRSDILRRLSGADLALPARDRLVEISAAAPGHRLLHMDFRPANLLTCAGRILGVIDWANALLGPPALELARIAEYQTPLPDLLAGYGDPEALARIPRCAELLFRLDTAVMLALVFLSEAPDPERAPGQVARAVSLAAELRRHVD